MNKRRADYPVQLLSRLLGCARSSLYDEPAEADERELLSALEAILMRWPFYGYRRMQAQLQRECFEVGERRVRRLLQVLGGSR